MTDPHEVKQQGTDPSTTSSAEKDNANWVTGDEPMTGPQASYLETLAHQAGEEPPTGLTKAQASDEIERLQGSVTPSGGDGGNGTGGDGQPDLSRQERPTTDWVTGRAHDRSAGQLPRDPGPAGGRGAAEGTEQVGGLAGDRRAAAEDPVRKTR
ncbi:hypothetical protein GCM10023199_27340 [Actinomycetospora chibensis]